MTQFEILPNEILLECFNYLNMFDIFHCFDQLNYRLYKLIRTIPLHLNFQYMRKLSFEQFYIKLLKDPIVKEQIYSIELSFNNADASVDLFFKFFSSDIFSNLQSIKLIKIQNNNVYKLKLMLLLTPKLSSFHLIDCKFELKEILSNLSTVKLQRLSIPKLNFHSICIRHMSSVMYLTVSHLSLNDLRLLFKYIPMLEYLNVQLISEDYEHNSWIHNYSAQAINLKQWIIGEYNNIFQSLKIFLEKTLNLKSLTICAINNEELIDAWQWQDFIISSLPYLKNFKFKFSCLQNNANTNILDKFIQFQTDFWQEMHHWYTEYILDLHSAVIYTIPYVSNIYALESNSIRFPNKSLNTDTFHNVTHLDIHMEIVLEKGQFYFSNITSLTLQKRENQSEVGEEYIKLLKKNVNLCHLKHLNISSYDSIKTSALFEMLKNARQLSSMTINAHIWKSFFKNRELCNYLNRMIKKLDIYKSSGFPFNTFSEIKMFCQIFSNLEQLKCYIKQSDHLLPLLDQLPRLIFITVFVWTSDTPEDFHWFLNGTRILNEMSYIKYNNINSTTFETELCIWME